jgi:hypothetical protein
MGDDMTESDLLEVKEHLIDLQSMQVNALVAAGLHRDKKAKAYLKRLTRLRKTVQAEIACMQVTMPENDT